MRLTTAILAGLVLAGCGGQAASVSDRVPEPMTAEDAARDLARASGISLDGYLDESDVCEVLDNLSERGHPNPGLDFLIYAATEMDVSPREYARLRDLVIAC